jgi:hypothetical protein
MWAQKFAKSSKPAKPSKALLAKKVAFKAPADVPASTWNGKI